MKKWNIIFFAKQVFMTQKIYALKWQKKENANAKKYAKSAYFWEI